MMTFATVYTKSIEAMLRITEKGTVFCVRIRSDLRFQGVILSGYGPLQRILKGFENRNSFEFKGPPLPQITVS